MLNLGSALALPEGVSRTAALVAWVQSLFAPAPEPVLVGGAAVELYSGGAYTTGDLDFVGTVPAAVENALVRSGFRKQGRHWLQESAQIYLEFPSSSLHEGEKAIRRTSAGYSILVVTPEDLIAERLAAWRHWRSSVDGVNAWLVYMATRASLDRRRLRRQAKLRDAEGALRALQRLSRLATRRDVLPEEVERWALLGP